MTSSPLIVPLNSKSPAEVCEFCKKLRSSVRARYRVNFSGFFAFACNTCVQQVIIKRSSEPVEKITFDPPFYFDPESSITNSSDLVIPKQKIDVLFDYPLKGGVNFSLEADTPAGFTRGGLAKAIGRQYKKIYAASESYDEYDGPYGIYGHSLDHLSLTCVCLCSDGSYTLDIDS